MAAQFLCFPAEGFAKLSVLCLYKRIFLGKYFELIVKVLIAVVVIWTIGFFVAMFRRFELLSPDFATDLEVYCLPFDLHWNGNSTGCANTIPMFEAITVTDVLTDGKTMLTRMD